MSLLSVRGIVGLSALMAFLFRYGLSRYGRSDMTSSNNVEYHEH